MLYDDAKEAQPADYDVLREFPPQIGWTDYMRQMRAYRTARDRKRYYAAWSMRMHFALRNSPV